MAAALRGLHSLALRRILNETIHLRIASDCVSQLKQRKARSKPEAIRRAACQRQRSHFTEKIRLRVSPPDTCFQVAIAPYRFVSIN